MVIIENVVFSKNPVKVGETILIQVTISEIKNYPVFSFPFSNESLIDKCIEISIL